MRGGLLVTDPRNGRRQNTLQLLVNVGNPSRLDVMKELRKGNLLLKADIKDHHLLLRSCDQQAKMMFQYLAKWDPDCLMTGTFKCLPLSHAVMKDQSKRWYR